MTEVLELSCCAPPTGSGVLTGSHGHHHTSATGVNMTTTTGCTPVAHSVSEVGRVRGFNRDTHAQGGCHKFLTPARVKRACIYEVNIVTNAIPLRCLLLLPGDTCKFRPNTEGMPFLYTLPDAAFKNEKSEVIAVVEHRVAAQIKAELHHIVHHIVNEPAFARCLVNSNAFDWYQHCTSLVWVPASPYLLLNLLHAFRRNTAGNRQESQSA
jgi:hypothetical protein